MNSSSAKITLGFVCIFLERGEYGSLVMVSILVTFMVLKAVFLKINHHHHKHQGLDPLIRSVSRVTAARANASSVFQLFTFLVVCSGMISKGFGFVAFFATVKVSTVCINLFCLLCL